ncbi:50S ribosomal protein L25, partial [Candidatus Saccharibacteria bacterium]
MTDKVKIKVDKRQIVGKKTAGLRRAGIVPGVVYGKTHQPINIQFENNQLEKLLEKVGFSTPLTLVIDGKNYFSIVKNFDRDPIKRNIINVEFQSISAKDPIDAFVEFEIVGRGESLAERAGLMVMKVMEEIEIRALPNEMPSSIQLDITNLEKVGDHIAIKDIVLPKGATFSDKELDLHMAVVNVYDPAQIEAQNEATGGDAEDVSEVESENGA